MNNKLAKRSQPIDPEFQAVFEQAEAAPEPAVEVVSKRSGPSPNTSHRSSEATAPGGSPAEDELQALKRLAEENQERSIDRKKFQDGSFDQIENDLSNTIRLGWDFLTR